MFTGIIQALGAVQALSPTRVAVRCSATALTQSLELGDSVAVDGICLTVVEILSDGFVAGVSPETLGRTTLRDTTLEHPSRAMVNLEAALRVGSKLGGHFVSGHVDGVGHLRERQSTADSWLLSFEAPPSVARYIVPKGSVAVNGVSLTVADCNSEGSLFSVAVIPHSFAETNLSQLAPGAAVNLEADLLGKYVEKFLGLGQSTQNGGRTVTRQPVTAAFLSEHGFL
ncbi:riboflavin synthase [Leptolyngbya sp. FACHB-261]|uniref:riboflavin synthase n=1 Tax=Leptolyngbya sp. FACHB-261 TaxID=2692806 RepID=UPI001687C85B|nr:riboflavin synthase [Leptolyngbya sp. FACHB-261]MBD2100121.1 riboflavin synthase [Leptolyngbya sp. FACHB-261]